MNSPRSARRGTSHAILALIAASSLACPSSPGPVLPSDPAGLEGDVRELVDKHVALVRKDPGNGAVHGELGLVYEGNKLWAEAAEAFAIAAELDPQDPLWIYHRALALRGGGQTTQALELLDGSATLLGREAAAQFTLGTWLLEAGELDRAREAFDAAGLLAPTRPEPLVGLAEVHIAREKYDAARILLERALEMDSDYRQAHYLLGLAYRGLDRMEDAQRELALGQTVDRRGFRKRSLPDAYARRAATYSFNFADRIARATSLIQRDKEAEAVSILLELLAAKPDDTSVLNNLASAYIEMGRFVDAVPRLHRVLELDPTQFAAHINLGYAYLGLGQLDLALEHADLAAELAPEVGRVYLVRARILERMQDFPRMRVALQNALRYDSRNPGLQLMLGQLCLRLQDYQGAIDNLTQALQSTPDNVEGYIDLLQAYVRVGRMDLAEKTFQDLVRVAPNEPRIPNARRFLEQHR